MFTKRGIVLVPKASVSEDDLLAVAQVIEEILTKPREKD